MVASYTQASFTVGSLTIGSFTEELTAGRDFGVTDLATAVWSGMPTQTQQRKGLPPLRSPSSLCPLFRRWIYRPAAKRRPRAWSSRAGQRAREVLGERQGKPGRTAMRLAIMGQS